MGHLSRCAPGLQPAAGRRRRSLLSQALLSSSLFAVCLLLLLQAPLSATAVRLGSLGSRLGRLQPAASATGAHASPLRTASAAKAVAESSLAEVTFSGTPDCAELGFVEDATKGEPGQPDCYDMAPRGGSQCDAKWNAPGTFYIWTNDVNSGMVKVGCASRYTKKKLNDLESCENRIEGQLPPDARDGNFDSRCFVMNTRTAYQRHLEDVTKPEAVKFANAGELLMQDMLYCMGRWRGLSGIPDPINGFTTIPTSEWFNLDWDEVNCLAEKVHDYFVGDEETERGTDFPTEVQGWIEACGLKTWGTPAEDSSSSSGSSEEVDIVIEDETDVTSDLSGSLLSTRSRARAFGGDDVRCRPLPEPLEVSEDIDVEESEEGVESEESEEVDITEEHDRGTKRVLEDAFDDEELLREDELRDLEGVSRPTKRKATGGSTDSL